MTAAGTIGDRTKELWRRLAEVHDPELDEPVTAMGFVERAEVANDGDVEVDFRLPTYWCSPNFAYLMLDGVRAALAELSWFPHCRIKLHDHLFAEEINRGLECGQPFRDIFAELTLDEDLESLREIFKIKAFRRRQEVVLLGFRQSGVSDHQILNMDLAAFDATPFESEEAAKGKPRYRAILLERFHDLRDSDPVFVDWEGKRISALGFEEYLAELRSVRVNMEFNGVICRGLMHSRYKELDAAGAEPMLVDFMTGR